ncbi:PAS domain S-box protein [Candidatus Nitrospira bockiana]
MTQMEPLEPSKLEVGCEQHRLRASEQRFRAAFEQAAIGMAITTFDGRFVAVNPRYCEITGYSRAELFGRESHWILHPEDRSTAAALVEDLRSGVRAQALVQVRCVRKDGRLVWVKTSVSALHDADGPPAYLLVLAEDVTEQRRAEEAHQESEQRYKTMFEQVAVGMAEYDLTGRFLHANQKLCEIYGRPESELQGQTFQALTHPEDLERSMSYFRDALSGKRDTYSIEKRYVRPNGRPVWCHVTASVVRDAAGRPLYFLAVVEDISNRKRVEEALASVAAGTACADEDCFACLVKHLASLLGVKCAFIGEVQYANPERVRTVALWAEGRLDETAICDLDDLSGERILGLESRFIDHGAKERFPGNRLLNALGVDSFYGVPLVDQTGELLGLLAVMDDHPMALSNEIETIVRIFAARAGVELDRQRTLKALRFSDQALRQLIREREQLAQDLHDGLIQSIYAAALSLEEAWRLIRDGSPEAIDQVGSVITDLNSIIEEVRNHIVGKSRDLRDGRQLKHELERMARVLGTAATVRIRATVDRHAADLLTPEEASHVYYIAREALSNAVRHSQARHARLSLRLVRGAVRLEISDNGIGFDSGSTRQEGHGLWNLSVRAYRLGSELKLSSAPGRGTRIIVDVQKGLTDG